MIGSAAPLPSNGSISLVEAMAIARRSVAMFSDLPVDSVVSCTATDTGWAVLIDVIESAARLGDNDLLATYELTLATDGEVTAFSRARRYHREDKE